MTDHTAIPPTAVVTDHEKTFRDYSRTNYNPRTMDSFLWVRSPLDVQGRVFKRVVRIEPYDRSLASAAEVRVR